MFDIRSSYGFFIDRALSSFDAAAAAALTANEVDCPNELTDNTVESVDLVRGPKKLEALGGSLGW